MSARDSPRPSTPKSGACNCGTTAAMAIIESIPNVSEGRRPEVVERLADAVRGTPGVRLLDYSSDAAHNRSVFTLAGDAGSLKTATMALFEQAVPRSICGTHRGEHPRLGAVDVVPFVPIEGVTMKECVALAMDVAASVAERFGVPDLSLRGGVRQSAAQEPRRHPARRVRGARGRR